MGRENELPRGQAEQLLQLIEDCESLFQRIENGEKTDDIADLLKAKLIRIGEKGKSYDIAGKYTARNIRNQFAHSDSNDEFWQVLPKLKEQFEEIKKNKRKCQKIINKDSTNKAKRSFEKHADSERFGDKQNRKKTVNAMEDAFDNKIDKSDKSQFPSANEMISKTVGSISKETKKYVGDHQGLSEDVQSDILNWSERTSTEVEIETNSHFQKESDFLKKIKKSGGVDFFDHFEEYEKAYQSIDTADRNFDMQRYKKMLQNDLIKLGDNPDEKDIKDYKKAYFQVVLKALTENFNARKAAYEQKQIDEKRKKFLEELYKKIENFKKLEQLLQPIINDLGHGYLWDMSNQPFRYFGFDILQKYASLLKNDNALQEFAELLGRQSATAKEVEKKIIEEIIIRSEFHPQPAQRGNVVGFEYSNEISRVLPSEMALLTDPDLENLFYLKLVEKQLLSYSYSQDVAEIYRETRPKEIEISKTKDETGPIIICVDTSGSMRGAPEQTAKIATFAIAKNAMRHNRKCFLISFSKGIETLDLADFKKTNALETLVNFLNKSFNGGTDAAPALAECLRQLKTENYKNADVLMISDFVMSSLPYNIVTSIEKEKMNGTSFYSLVIGQSANNQAIECFNENIPYNPYDESSRQEFSRKVHEMASQKKRETDII